jgi:hypothetical protein
MDEEDIIAAIDAEMEERNQRVRDMLHKHG